MKSMRAAMMMSQADLNFLTRECGDTSMHRFQQSVDFSDALIDSSSHCLLDQRNRKKIEEWHLNYIQCEEVPSI